MEEREETKCRKEKRRTCGEPACTARVPKPWTGEGARGGVSIGWSIVVEVVVRDRRGRWKL